MIRGGVHIIREMVLFFILTMDIDRIMDIKIRIMVLKIRAVSGSISIWMASGSQVQVPSGEVS